MDSEKHFYLEPMKSGGGQGYTRKGPQGRAQEPELVPRPRLRLEEGWGVGSTALARAQALWTLPEACPCVPAAALRFYDFSIAFRTHNFQDL